MNGRLLLFVAVVAVVAAVVVVRSGDDTEAPVGEELLPDLWTSAPFQLGIAEVDDRAVLRFTSELNNHGAGDLLLHGEPNSSNIRQLIQYSESGHQAIDLDATVV